MKTKKISLFAKVAAVALVLLLVLQPVISASMDNRASTNPENMILGTSEELEEKDVDQENIEEQEDQEDTEKSDEEDLEELDEKALADKEMLEGLGASGPSTFANTYHEEEITNTHGAISVRVGNTGNYRVDDHILAEKGLQTEQFYGTRSAPTPENKGFDVGTRLYIDGKEYSTGYIDYASASVSNDYGGSLGNGDLNLSPDGRTATITWEFQHGENSGNFIIFKQSISVPKDGRYAPMKWTIENKSGKPLNDVRLIHGGDTYFAGSDYGFGQYRDGRVYVYRDENSGLMSFQGDSATPADRYFVGSYSTGRNAARNNQLTNYASGPNSGNVDQGYYLQWNFNVPNGTTKEIRATQTWSSAGSINIAPPSGITTPAQVTISYTFDVTNSTKDPVTIVLTPSSSRGWNAYIVGATTITVPPGTTESVIVLMDIPLSAKDGNVDELTLTGVNANNANETYVATVPTTIQINKPAIQDIVILSQTDTQLRVAVKFINVNVGTKLSTFVEIYNIDGTPISVSGTWDQTKVIESGGEFVFDITNLPKDERYWVASEVDQIEYPSRKPFDIYSQAQGIEISPQNKIIQVGDTLQFSGKILPESSANKNLLWEVDNTTLATIDTNGIVTGLKPGVVKVTVRAAIDPTNVHASTNLTIHNPTSEIEISASDKNLLLKAGTSKDVSVNIKPTNASIKDTDWTSSNTGIATVAKSSGANDNPQKAKITGVSDGKTKVVIASKDTIVTPKVTGTIDVTVDGTAPIFDVATFEETANLWDGSAAGNSRLVTNREIKIILKTSDPVVNSVSTGVKEVYYKVVSGSTVPSFDLSNTSGWTKHTGDSTSFLLNQNSPLVPNGGNDGKYGIFAVSVDKVGNYNSTPKKVSFKDDGEDEDIDIDTEVPEIALDPNLASKNMHVTINTVVNESFLKSGITIKDGATTGDLSKLKVTPSSVNTNAFGKHAIKYSYTDTAGNTATLERTLYIHEKPNVSSEGNLRLHREEGKINILNLADSRIKLVNKPIKIWVSSGSNIVEKTITPKVSFTPDSNISSNGEINLKTVTDNFIPIEYVSSYDSEFLSPKVQKGLSKTGIELFKIELTPKSATMIPGATEQFTFKVTPSISGLTNVWTSSDNTVASVNSNGLVTAHKPGTITLTVHPTNSPYLKLTATVTVGAPVTGIEIDGNKAEYLIKKGTKLNLSATIKPANTIVLDTLWKSTNTAAATVSKTSTSTENPQKATVTGVNDGQSTVTVSSIKYPGQVGTTIVKVDGTAPKFDVASFEETANLWDGSPAGNSRLATNREIKITLKSSDPVVNTVAAGVEEIYYQVVSGSTVPSFDLSNTSGWTKHTGDSTTFLLNKNSPLVPNSGNDGKYGIFAVSVDKVGNYDSTPKKITFKNDGEDEDIDIDTDKPEFVVDENFKTTHLTVGESIDLKDGITIKDGNSAGNLSKLIITPATISTNAFGKHEVNYSYTDEAGNSVTLDRTIYVHEVPAVTAKNIRVNRREGTINVLNPADPRLNFANKTIKVWNNINGIFQESPMIPTLKIVDGPQVAANGTIDLSAITGDTVTFTYEASYNSPYLTPALQKDVQKVTVSIYENGGNIEGPEIEIEPGGVVKPPIDGGKPNPQEETGVYRIEYFQDYGISMEDGSPGPKTLKVNDILAAINAVPANGTTVTIDRAYNGNAALKDADIATALKTIGEYPIQVTVVDNTTHDVLFVDVYLRVNGKLETSYHPADVHINAPASSVSNLSELFDTKASYVKYTGIQEPVPIGYGDKADVSKVHAQRIAVAFDYPFDLIRDTITLRVHGKIKLTTNDIDIRVAEPGTEGQALKKDVTATIQLAGPSAGTTKTMDITDKIVAVPQGNVSKIGQFNQTYTVDFQLSNEYQNQLAFDATGTRQVTVHGMPEITANDITVGPNYTAADFGDEKTNPLVKMDSGVTYYGKSKTDLKSAVTATNTINFNSAGNYKITFKVSDANAVGRPSGLAPVETIKVVNFNISSENTGDGPMIIGADNVKWLQNKTLLESDLLQGVSAQEPSNFGATDVQVSVRKNGSEVSLTQAVSTYDVYQIEYSSIDSFGNKSTTEKELQVYGVLENAGAPAAHETRQSNDTYKFDLNAYDASYRGPQGEKIPVTYATDTTMYKAGSAPSTKAIGKTEAKVTISHPVFPEDNNITTSREVRVNGPIEIVGTEKYSDVEYFYMGEGKDTTIGVDASYMSYDKVNRKNLPVVSSAPTYNGTAPGKFPIVYTVEDDLGFPDVTKVIELRVNRVPVFFFSSTFYTVNFSGRARESDIANEIGYRENYTHYYDNPNKKISLDPIYDFSKINLSQEGTYPLIVIAKDKFGKERTYTVDIVLRDLGGPAIDENAGVWYNYGGGIIYYFYDDGRYPENETLIIDGESYQFGDYGLLLSTPPPGV